MLGYSSGGGMTITRAGDHLICPAFKILIMYSTEKFLCPAYHWDSQGSAGRQRAGAAQVNNNNTKSITN